MTVYLPGEVYEDRDGDHWFVVACIDYDGSHMRGVHDNLAPADFVEDSYGPLTRVFPAEVTS